MADKGHTDDVTKQALDILDDIDANDDIDVNDNTDVIDMGDVVNDEKVSKGVTTDEYDNIYPDIETLDENEELTKVEWKLKDTVYFILLVIVALTICIILGVGLDGIQKQRNGQVPQMLYEVTVYQNGSTLWYSDSIQKISDDGMLVVTDTDGCNHYFQDMQYVAHQYYIKDGVRTNSDGTPLDKIDDTDEPVSDVTADYQ